MKNLIYLFSVFLFTSCLSEDEQFSEINFKFNEVKLIVIENPVDDVYMWGIKKDTIYPNDKNEFVFRKKISSPQHINININGNIIHSILQPKNKLHISYKDSSFVFKGKNNEGIRLLNNFKRDYYSFSEADKYKKDSTTNQIEKNIENQKNKEIQQVRNLINNNEIDNEFAKLLKDEINYYYSNRTLEIINDKLKTQKQNKEELNILFSNTIKKHPLDNLYKPSSWNEYANSIYVRKPIVDLKNQNIITEDSLQNWWKNDKINEFKYNLIEKIKNKSIREKVLANYLNFSSRQDHFEKSLIKLFKRFFNEYPNSKYVKYLKREFKKNEDYHLKISKKMPETVHFVKGENISSLDELLKVIETDKYYVDMWATWCGPCKDQFKYNKELNKTLKEKGYKKLYISIDKPENIEKWKKDIKYYELDGLHFLANQEFFVHFTNNYSPYKGYVIIPQYLIVNEKDSILESNAPRPSQLKKLSEVLN